MLVVEIYIVWYVWFAKWQLGFYYGVSAFLYVNHHTVVYDGAHILVFFGNVCECQQAVEACHKVGVDLYLWDKLLHILHQFVEKTRFESEYFLVGTKYFGFVFLQFGGNVAFCLRKGLLANPVGRHLVFKCIAHLKVVSENVVEAYLQRTDARLGSFLLLNVEQNLLSVVANGAQFV